MELGFETFLGRNRRIAVGAAGHPLDWSGLHARLAAAHAARRMLLAESSVGSVGGGSFDSRTAEAIFAFDEALSAVNLTDSADGKSVAGNEMGVAAALVPGGRG
jgi:hypothetical protein